MDEDLGGFAPPRFQAEEALVKLRRELQALGLTARGGIDFERRGQPIARVVIEDGMLKAARVRRPSRAPEWLSRPLRHAADVRDFLADLKKQLAQWSDRDD